MELKLKCAASLLSLVREMWAEPEGKKVEKKNVGKKVH